MAVSITSINQSTPYLKEEVMIKGTGFGSSGNNTITVGGTSATIVSDITTRVNFVVPSSLTEGNTYTVKLTNTTDGTSDTVSITIESEPPDKEKNFIAIFFGKYVSGQYQTDKSGIPYTAYDGTSVTNGDTPSVLFNICNPDPKYFTCQTSSGAGQYGHTKILEGVSGEKAVTYKDFRWASANSDITKEQSKWIYTIPTHSLTLSKKTFASGDKVTIKGPGITPNATVKIGTTSATVNFISYEYLEFTVPTLSGGSYTLTYTDKAGTTSTFTVTISKAPSVPKPLKTIPVVSGLTGSVVSVSVNAVGVGKDTNIDIECKGDVQILTKIYLDIVITKPDKNTWTHTTSKVDVKAGKKHTFSITFPGSEGKQDGTYIIDIDMWSELWVGTETTPRDSEVVDTYSREFILSNKLVILRQETMDSLPDKFILGYESEFSIWVQNFTSNIYTTSAKMRIIHDSLVTTSACGYRRPSPCDKNDCTMDCSDLTNYDYFDIPSSKVSVNANTKYEFKLKWTPPRKTKLGDYYICADLCCDEC